jgi:hypothetical protein
MIAALEAATEKANALRQANDFGVGLHPGCLDSRPGAPGFALAWTGEAPVATLATGGYILWALDLQ